MYECSTAIKILLVESLFWCWPHHNAGYHNVTVVALLFVQSARLKVQIIKKSRLVWRYHFLSRQTLVPVVVECVRLEK